MAPKWQLWLCVILLLFSQTNARQLVKSSFEHRKSLTAPFRLVFQQKLLRLEYGIRDVKEQGSGYTPTRVSPGGPDPKHH